MDKFLEMKVFSAVVEAGSFTGAARTLDMSKAAVSRYVAELEERLGVRLLHRTTRKLSATGEGEIFHARCRELLDNLDEAEAEISSRSGQASGLLKVSVPVTFGLMHLAPLWPPFLALHPKLDLDITLSDRVVDLVEDGFDLAVRIVQLPSSSLISRKLASTRMVLCASPDYLARRGEPARPPDLLQHDVISYSLFSSGEHWTFTGPGGEATVKVAPRVRTNSGDTCRAAALQHQGIVLQPSFIVGTDLARGLLLETMKPWRAGELGVYAVYPSRKFVSPKVRLLIDFLVDAFADPAWD
ncbi:LysR family transcriptional regulator [Telluria aromaticivorans]|uniref:LysR family transcriptional regulator n=1 Tax=Telluria aromaticivorans TaxID=2725995 RepID=A0A7Y2P2N4_9BURK|nr:LysR family transcriptional regulator [Telluria aromaticivorans]NNG25826.1 LysR family transcriptional regulator [Telluria aromaticivorans]